MEGITIREGTIAEMVSLTQQLTEFHSPYGAEEYEKRLPNVTHLILIAETAGKAVGCKAGYQRDNDGSFYSWIGGVLPDYRRKGIAEQLAERQEQWAREKGYRSVRFKTLNRHKSMLLFAIKRGFDLISIEPRGTLPEYRIWLEKQL